MRICCSDKKKVTIVPINRVEFKENKCKGFLSPRIYGKLSVIRRLPYRAGVCKAGFDCSYLQFAGQHFWGLHRTPFPTFQNEENWQPVGTADWVGNWTKQGLEDSNTLLHKLRLIRSVAWYCCLCFLWPTKTGASEPLAISKGNLWGLLFLQHRYHH